MAVSRLPGAATAAPPTEPAPSLPPGDPVQSHAGRRVSLGEPSAPVAPAVAARGPALPPRGAARKVSFGHAGTTNLPGRSHRPDVTRARLFTRLADQVRGLLRKLSAWWSQHTARRAAPARDTAGTTDSLPRDESEAAPYEVPLPAGGADYETPLPFPATRNPTSPLPPLPDTATRRTRPGDITGMMLLLQQLSGVAVAIRERVHPQVDAGRAQNRDELVALIREATADHLANHRVEQWCRAEAAAVHAPGSVDAIPPEEVFDAVDALTASHPDILDTAAVEQDARALIRDILLRTAAGPPAGESS